jgi:hypothetical protein
MGSYLSPGVENLVHVLNPWGRPEGQASFPAGLGVQVPRAKGHETVQQWFVRAVDTALEGRPDACSIAVGDNRQMGLLGSIHWHNGSELSFARLHAIVCEGMLDDLYLDETSSVPAYYLRLDYDLEALGELFSHPHPHVHSAPWPKFALRFPPDMAETGNVVMDFVDFLYRNFFHATWMEWARSTWESEAVRLAGRSAVEEDLFSLISEAFRASQPQMLRQQPYRGALTRMKRVWRESRDSLFPLRVPPDLSRLLSLHM